MAGAGLTHGGSYSYFKSKSDLYAAVRGGLLYGSGVEKLLGRRACGFVIDRRPQVVRAYLSRQHFEDVENSWPMVALPTDVARHPEASTNCVLLVMRRFISPVGNLLNSFFVTNCFTSGIKLIHGRP